MDIAIIIPLFNGAKWIGSTLESVFAQSQQPKEVVVIDDGSEDDSKVIAGSFAGVKILDNPHQGVHYARNYGWQQTQAQLIAFLDQDDIWHRDHLQLLSCLLEQYSNCPAAMAGICSFKSGKIPDFTVPVLDACLFDPWNNFPVNPIDTPSGVLIRRTALEIIGGWPTQLVAANDAQTWFKLSASYPLIRNRGVTVGYRLHALSFSTNLRRQNSEQYFKSVITSAENSLAYRLAIRPENAEQLKRRLVALNSMMAVIHAIKDLDRAQLRKSASTIEENLANEPTKFIQAICYMLFWFLIPMLCGEKSAQKTEALENLLSGWPENANRTRQAIFYRTKGLVSLWSFWQYVSNCPWQMQRWLIFTDVMWLRITRKLKRLAQI